MTCFNAALVLGWLQGGDSQAPAARSSVRLPRGRRRNSATKYDRPQAEPALPRETKRPNTSLKPGVGPLRALQESHMQSLQSKQRAAWRCRREQYLRESGRHVDLIREGYAAADDATNWTVVVGGRGRGRLKRELGTRLFLVKPSLDQGAQCKQSNAPAACG
jgi:hypothetical protein